MVKALFLTILILFSLLSYARTFSIYKLGKDQNFDSLALKLFQNEDCADELRQNNPHLSNTRILNQDESVLIPKVMNCKRGDENFMVEIDHQNKKDKLGKDEEKYEVIDVFAYVNQLKGQRDPASLNFRFDKDKFVSSIGIGAIFHNLSIVEKADSSTGNLNSDMSLGFNYKANFNFAGANVELGADVSKVNFTAGKTRTLRKSSYTLINVHSAAFFKNKYFTWGPIAGFDQKFFLRSLSLTEIFVENFHLFFAGVKVVSRNFRIFNVDSSLEGYAKFYPPIARTSSEIEGGYLGGIRYNLDINDYGLYLFSEIGKLSTEITDQNEARLGMGLSYRF